jgi:hypothetical protein
MSGAEQTDAAAKAPEPERDTRLVSIEAGARGLLADRGGAVLAGTLPADLPLVLHADVRVIPLADVLGLVHALGTSGFLFFSQRDHAKSVYLHRGEVVFATSNQRVDRLGECLLRAGVITIEQLREAERRFTPPDRFGKALVERGFLTPRELWHGVKYQVEEIVRSLFSYTGGMVELWEGDVQPDNVVRLSLPTRRLVAEGIQRRDELMKFLALLEDPRVVLTPVAGREVSLAANERALFDALTREGSFGALRRRVGLDALSAARVVQLLRLVGAVRVVRTRDDGTYLGESDLRVHDDASIREHVSDHVKLLSELAAPIVAADGDDGLRERLGRIVEGLAQRHPELLSGIQLGAGATLDPEVVAERTLGLAGERRQQVAAVLGELRDYLEFELKNHPGISGADRILDGLKDLRARLEA